MDELIKFLTSKIGYTLIGILGFGLPGNLFIFVWNRSLYLDMDIIKLLILSFGIPFMVFIPNVFLCFEGLRVIELIFKKESSFNLIVFMPIVFMLIELMLGMVAKILNPIISISDFIIEIGPRMFWAFLAFTFINGIGRIRKK